MVVKMMKWRPWPVLINKKFQLRLLLESLEGLSVGDNGSFEKSELMAHVKWKGPKRKLGSRFRSIQRNCTALQRVRENGIVEWNENFDHVTLDFVELQTSQEAFDPVHRLLAPSLSCIGGHMSEKGDPSALKSDLQKEPLEGKPVKTSSEEDGSDCKLSPRSEECESPDLFDSESTDECNEDDAEDGDGSSFWRSFSYDTLAAANLSVGAVYLDCKEDEYGDYESRNIKTSLDPIPKLIDEPSSSDSDHSLPQPAMRRLLSWKSRKFSFRSPRAKGEPLLKKAYGEEGGDDIDFYRRQSRSHIEPPQLETALYQLPPKEQKLAEEKSSTTSISATKKDSKSTSRKESKLATTEDAKSATTENAKQNVKNAEAQISDTRAPETLCDKHNEERLICKGKESCKAFINGFLAALPLRDLQVDMKKGLMGQTLLHHRLQIEFHFTSE